MTEQGEGERVEARRRKIFWTSLGIIAAGGAIVGFFTGIRAASKNVGFGESWSGLPEGLVIALMAVSLMAFLYGTWRFFKAIDEVELVDNLWASTAAYYVYGVLFPIWWVLGKSGIVAEPNDWAIYIVALGAGMVIYLGRKWRAR